MREDFARMDADPHVDIHIGGLHQTRNIERGATGADRMMLVGNRGLRAQRPQTIGDSRRLC